MSTLTAPNPNTEQISINRLLWVGPLAGVIAAIANLIVFVIAQNLMGIELLAPVGSSSTEMVPLPAAAVIMASIFPAIGAAILLVVLGKFLARPIRVFWIISVVFLLLSLVAPLGLPVSLAVKLTLELMHLTAGVVIVAVLTALGREK